MPPTFVNVKVPFTRKFCNVPGEMCNSFLTSTLRSHCLGSWFCGLINAEISLIKSCLNSSRSSLVTISIWAIAVKSRPKIEYSISVGLPTFKCWYRFNCHAKNPAWQLKSNLAGHFIQFSTQFFHVLADFCINDLCIMLCGFNIHMTEHLTYAFNRHPVCQCYCGGESMP
jgi:hypothetical protein